MCYFCRPARRRDMAVVCFRYVVVVHCVCVFIILWHRGHRKATFFSVFVTRLNITVKQNVLWVSSVAGLAHVFSSAF